MRQNTDWRQNKGDEESHAVRLPRWSANPNEAPFVLNTITFETVRAFAGECRVTPALVLPHGMSFVSAREF